MSDATVRPGATCARVRRRLRRLLPRTLRRFLVERAVAVSDALVRPGATSARVRRRLLPRPLRRRCIAAAAAAAADVAVVAGRGHLALGGAGTRRDLGRRLAIPRVVIGVLLRSLLRWRLYSGRRRYGLLMFSMENAPPPARVMNRETWAASHLAPTPTSVPMAFPFVGSFASVEPMLCAAREPAHLSVLSAERAASRLRCCSPCACPGRVTAFRKAALVRRGLVRRRRPRVAVVAVAVVAVAVVAVAVVAVVVVAVAAVAVRGKHAAQPGRGHVVRRCCRRGIKHLDVIVRVDYTTRLGHYLP